MVSGSTPALLFFQFGPLVKVPKGDHLFQVFKRRLST